MGLKLIRTREEAAHSKAEKALNYVERGKVAKEGDNISVKKGEKPIIIGRAPGKEGLAVKFLEAEGKDESPKLSREAVRIKQDDEGDFVVTSLTNNNRVSLIFLATHDQGREGGCVYTALALEKGISARIPKKHYSRRFTHIAVTTTGGQLCLEAGGGDGDFVVRKNELNKNEVKRVLSSRELAPDIELNKNLSLI